MEGNGQMEFSKLKMRQIALLMVFATCLVMMVIYFKDIYKAIDLTVKIIMPFLVGAAIAFVLNIPMKFIEDRLLKNWKGKTANKLKRTTSILLTVLFVILLLTLLVVIVAPQISSAITDVAKQLPAFYETLIAKLTVLSEKYPALQDSTKMLTEIENNWDTIIENVAGFMQSGISSVLNTTIGVAGGIINTVTTAVIAFVFSIYVLAQKEKLGDQVQRILKAYVKKKPRETFLRVCAIMNKNFTSFITGQCLEAIILGCMFVVSMLIFRMPYALMIGVLIAFTALIPIVGAFIGCVVGAFLILLENPMLAIGFIILFLVLQQIEGNLIYPRVVGSSVGLPAIWVLFAVSVGGSLFGIVGMLVFIPLMSTVYTLIREDVNRRNSKNSNKENTKEQAN